MDITKYLDELLAVAGLILICISLALIYTPLAIMFAGTTFVAFAWLSAHRDKGK